MSRSEHGAAGYRVTADVGGTFTDLTLHDAAGSELATAKTLTTPEDPSKAILAGAEALVKRARRRVPDMSYFIHATTLVTNTIIERSGARTGLLMTAGFRDILEMATETRYDMYDLGLELPPPLVPRTLRREVPERMSFDGRVLTPLDEEAVRQAVHSLASEGIEALAICFLHAYANPLHEQIAGRIVEEAFPQLSISLSSAVQPEIREYERVSTTVANAYTQPRTRDYLRLLEGSLRTAGFEGGLSVMLSSGGLTTARNAAALPVKILESGPAAGVEAARTLGAAIGIGTLVSFDMGGTTAKIGLVEDGEASLASQLEVARLHRFKKGSGLIVKSPTVELIEIGAGGGSIAWIDQYGLLKVGPRSAGSVPGPACYARGGEQATVTDADLFLGYLDAEDFAGGSMRLDTGAATSAIERLAQGLGLSAVEAAWGVHEIANENMATAGRIHLVERGKDPGAFALVAFGGAGPTHAQAVAAKLGVKRVIVPRNAGVMSAVGLLAAPRSVDVIHSLVVDLDDLAGKDVDAVLADLAESARNQLASVSREGIRFSYGADMRYRGQGSEIAVQLSPDMAGRGLDQVSVREAFNAAYDRLYGRHIDGAPIQIVSLRVRAVAESGTFRFGQVARGEGQPTASKRRPVYFPGQGYLTTPVYSHQALRAGERFDGPAIVQSPEFAALLAPSQSCTVDSLGNLDIRI